MRSYWWAIMAILGVLPPKVWAQPVSDQDLQSNLPEACYHTGAFRQEKQLNGLAQPLVTEGYFVFSCANGLLWHTQIPIIETSVYKTSGTHWLISPDNRQQPLRGKSHQMLGQVLNHLLGGDIQYLRQQFNISNENSALMLTPKSPRLQKALQSIQIKKAGMEESETVELWLQHSASEYTHIQIVNRQSFTQLNAESCTQTLPTQAMACSALFEP